MSKQKTPPEIEAVIEGVGCFIQYWGFKKIEGKIWAFVFLAGKAQSTDTIMDFFGISKALASISLAKLKENEVLLLHSKREKGIQYYIANTDIEAVIKGVLRRRESAMLAQIAAATDNALRLASQKSTDKTAFDRKRLLYIKRMLKVARLILDQIILSKRFSGRILAFGKAPDSDSHKTL